MTDEQYVTSVQTWEKILSWSNQMRLTNPGPEESNRKKKIRESISRNSLQAM